MRIQPIEQTKPNTMFGFHGLGSNFILFFPIQVGKIYIFKTCYFDVF